MSELSPETREFLARERHSDAPSATDRKRIRERLMLELGAAAFTASAGAGAVQQIAQQTSEVLSPSEAPAATGHSAVSARLLPAKLSLATKLVLSSLVLGGAGALLWPSAGPVASPAPEVAPRVQPVAPAPSQPLAEHEPPVALAVAEAAAEAPAPATAPAKRRIARPRAEEASSPLAEELALLSTAQSALRAGNPSESLRIAAEHARRFPRGSMRDERLGIEALSRCALGEPGAEAAAQFLRETSGSPLAPAVRKACKLP
jgi:hypothetical protein